MSELGEAALEAWFGGSRVAGPTGAPLVLFHGSRSPARIQRLRTPAYFSDNEAWCRGFGDVSLYRVHLRILRPYVFDGVQQGRHFAWDREDVRRMKAEGYDGVIVRHPEGDVYAVFDPGQVWVLGRDRGRGGPDR